LWGQEDGILDGQEFATKFVDIMQDARLQWIPECGHVPHLEKPDETADAIGEFLFSISPARKNLPTGGLALVGTTVMVATAAAAVNMM
jgi:hypothetical protein